MEQNSVVMEQCSICEDRTSNGIYVYHLFICRECEHNMVHTEPRQEKYQYYLRKLKPIAKSKLYS